MTQSQLFLKTLSSSIEQTLEIPMWGKTPNFPWNAFCEAIKDGIGVDSLVIETQSSDWKEPHQLNLGFEEDALSFSFCLSPLSATFHLLISKQDLDAVIKILVTEEEKRSFSDQVFQKGFSKYILLHILSSFDQISPYEGLKLRLTEKDLQKESSYVVDLSIKIGEKEILPRMIFPLSFHKVLSSHFSSKPTPLQHLDPLLEIPAALEVGKVSISRASFEKISVGDFLILDECSYQPKTQHGNIYLVIGSSILFVLRRKNSDLKILDYGLFNFEPSYPKEDNMNNDLDDDLDNSIEFDDESSADLPSASEPSIDKIISSSEVPLLLKVEVGKLTLSLGQLLSLKPGNTLPLGHTLEQGVNITLNSKVVAKGDLIQLGEMIGVKINEVGN